MHYFLNTADDLLQGDLKTKEKQVSDLREALKTQQAETAKAKEELTNALTVMEQLKENRKKEQADWATEKALLTKRAENAKAALKPVVDELSSVKRQIHSMTSAVFGKFPSMPFFQFVLCPLCLMSGL